MRAAPHRVNGRRRISPQPCRRQRASCASSALRRRVSCSAAGSEGHENLVHQRDMDGHTARPSCAAAGDTAPSSNPRCGRRTSGPSGWQKRRWRRQQQPALAADSNRRPARPPRSRDGRPVRCGRYIAGARAAAGGDARGRGDSAASAAAAQAGPAACAAHRHDTLAGVPGALRSAGRSADRHAAPSRTRVGARAAAVVGRGDGRGRGADRRRRRLRRSSASHARIGTAAIGVATGVREANGPQ